jgi:hypothetical protein
VRQQRPAGRRQSVVPPSAADPRSGIILLLSISVSLSVVVSACSNTDPSASADSESSEDEGADSRTSEPPSSTQPPASDPAAVRPYVEELLAGYDEVVTEIVAEPSVAQDRDHPAVEEFLSLFEPGSDFAEGSLDGWVENAETGVVLEPVSGDQLVNVTTLAGDPRAVSDDEVAFARCVEQSYVRIEDGEETDQVDGELLAGEGVAVLVDGRWLLRELTTPPGLQACGTRNEPG